MSMPAEEKAQSSLEAILITGVIISVSAYLMAYYFGDVSDQTTAIIMLKTELLKQLSPLGESYVISGPVKTVLEPNGTLCMEVKTEPSNPAVGAAAITAIEDLIKAKTKYKTGVTIKLNNGAC